MLVLRFENHKVEFLFNICYKMGMLYMSEADKHTHLQGASKPGVEVLKAGGGNFNKERGNKNAPTKLMKWGRREFVCKNNCHLFPIFPLTSSADQLTKITIYGTSAPFLFFTSCHMLLEGSCEQPEGNPPKAGQDHQGVRVTVSITLALVPRLLTWEKTMGNSTPAFAQGE